MFWVGILRGLKGQCIFRISTYWEDFFKFGQFFQGAGLLFEAFEPDICSCEPGREAHLPGLRCPGAPVPAMQAKT